MNKDLAALRDVLQETLQRRGVLNEVRSRLRAEIFAALDEGEDLAGKGKAPYEVGQENLLINELIREYLTYNGYKHTLSVFMPESGQPTDAGEKITRAMMCHDMGLHADEMVERVPLIYSAVSQLQIAARQSERRSAGTRPAGTRPAVSASSSVIKHEAGGNGNDVGYGARQSARPISSPRQPIPLEFTNK